MVRTRGLWLATAQEISGQLQAEVVTLRQGPEMQPKDMIFSIFWAVLTSDWGKQESRIWRRLQQALRVSGTIARGKLCHQ